MFALGHEVRRYIPKTANTRYNDAVIASRRVHALDVDPTRQFVYWSDTSEKAIMRAVIPESQDLMGYPQDLEIASIQEPNGIALDTVTGYWELSLDLFPLHSDFFTGIFYLNCMELPITYFMEISPCKFYWNFPLHMIFMNFSL